MSGDAKNSEINSVAIYSRLTKNMSQLDWTIKGLRINGDMVAPIPHIRSVIYAKLFSE